MGLVIAAQTKRKGQLQAKLEEVLTDIVKRVNERKEHIPPVTSGILIPFPYEITVAGYAPHHTMTAEGQPTLTNDSPLLVRWV